MSGRPEGAELRSGTKIAVAGLPFRTDARGKARGGRGPHRLLGAQPSSRCPWLKALLGLVELTVEQVGARAGARSRPSEESCSTRTARLAPSSRLIPGARPPSSDVVELPPGSLFCETVQPRSVAVSIFGDPDGSESWWTGQGGPLGQPPHAPAGESSQEGPRPQWMPGRLRTCRARRTPGCRNGGTGPSAAALLGTRHGHATAVTTARISGEGIELASRQDAVAR